MSTPDVNQRWPSPGYTRVPFEVFSDPEIYAREQERIFRGPIWHFLCLEIDLPNPGDYRTGVVGETPIIVTRDQGGELHAMVNRCAHKGALVCYKKRGNARTLSCIYHAWNYELDGRLRGVAFQKGTKGQGGMPEDFDPKQHRLEPLRLEVCAGIVFGTFSEETPGLRSYIGDSMLANIERNLTRPVKLLGYHSQIIHNNWKLYAENVRDPYHATLLHTFYTTFKINRLDMDGGLVLSDRGWHSLSYAKRATWEKDDEYESSAVHSAQYDSQLQGPELVGSWNEFEDGITHSIQTVFPTLAIQFTLNSLAVRFFTPKGVDKTELHWMFLGYESDQDNETAMRTMQANLTGAAGLVSMEDGCINEFVQRGTRGSRDRNAFLEMGGKEVASSQGSRATESAIRGFWQGYRDVMGLT